MLKKIVTGFPRIGEKRELKFALESYWSGESEFESVQKVAKELKRRHWSYQREFGMDRVCVGDFSYYDIMLDTAIMLNAVPKRFQDMEDKTELYFAMARGDDTRVAMEMTKWFDTNYHYIVPELSKDDNYKVDASKIINEYKEAKNEGFDPKISIIGPITFLALSKRVDGGECFEFFEEILQTYENLLKEISYLDEEILLQIEEPFFVTGIDGKVSHLIKRAYERLASVSKNIKIIVTTYFDHSCEATEILTDTPIYALGLDLIYGRENLNSLELIAKSGKTLVAGIIDARNIWINDMDKSLSILNDITETVPKEKIVINSSCSLLHLPYSLEYEDEMDPQIRSWLAFSKEKLKEINLLCELFFDHENISDKSAKEHERNKEINRQKRESEKTHDKKIRQRVQNIKRYERESGFKERIKIQHKELGYEPLATTTIGSFPQTKEIREARRDLKNGSISQQRYDEIIMEYIDETISFQEEIGLEILVHGEPERNDMVEYFGRMLRGFGFTQNGWVQSYGSRCVKPPFIYGDIDRKEPMTIKWIKYAQSKTNKIAKGMLTGPVTLLNWSFVRDDMPRSEVSKQMALAISDEVDDLQKEGIKIIQVDEAAFKEGYPLRSEKIAGYEEWAVRDFKLSTAKAYPKTQIHTHMCYSDFNDIIKTIEAMDADVISIETARSTNELLKVFEKAGYSHEVGPGVYDIHSPRIPGVSEIKKQIYALLEVLPKEQLWINPDCGLKTRKWEEGKPALRNRKKAGREMREELEIRS